MCIAIIKPKNVKCPSYKKLRTCFQNNDDGAGYAIYNPSACRWIVKKGFMTFSSFKKSLKKEKIDPADIVFYHFRIGTSGGTIGAYTHPFPISSNPADLMKLEYETENIIMHNGIMGAGEPGLSDTQVFIRDILYPLSGYIQKPAVFDVIKKCSEGSRLCIAMKDKIRLTGNWIDVDGIFYSNDTYKKCTFSYNLQDYSDIDVCCVCGIDLNYEDDCENGLCQFCSIMMQNI